MDFAEYQTLDPEARREVWANLSEEEQEALKAEGRAAKQEASVAMQAAPEEPTAGASEAVNAISQALGASVGRHLLKALTEAAAATGRTPDEVAARLLAGEDLGDMGVKETSTLKAAVNRLRGGGRKAVAPQVEVQATPQEAQTPQVPPLQLQAAQQQQAPVDLLSLLGGGG